MSRLDDDLGRDLTAIAERITPSPDAWASIQQRIADRDPDQETEIIMLTENTTTMRRWPLLAAAAAVIALAIVGVALVNRDDGDEAPATPPPPTAAVDTDTSADQTESVDTDTSADQTEPADESGAPVEAPAPRTFTLTGTQEGATVFGEPDDGGRASVRGTSTWSGDVTGSAEIVGFAGMNDAGDGLDGRNWVLVDATIDGVGSGMLVIDDRWSSNFDGTVEAEGTIVGGSGDLTGASGTYTTSAPEGSNDPDTPDVEVGGPYTLDLILPPIGDVASTESVSLAGRAGGALDFAVPDDPETPATYVGEETWTGDITGTGISWGDAVINDTEDGLEATGTRVVEATIEGLGSGVLVIDQTFSSKFTGSAEATGTIVAGTGDLAGATGTLESSTPDGSNDFETEGTAEFGGEYVVALTLPFDG
jgi:hypothetical protein